MTKKAYRVRNWKDYNKSLEQRGSIEIWLDPKIFTLNEGNIIERKQRGRPEKYQKSIIECMLVVKYVYHLCFRQTEGFMKDVKGLMNLGCDIPDYSTICKRQKDLDVEILKKCKSNRKKLYLSIDSSGLKVFGEGEWKVRQHGYSKKRTWKKLHIGLGVLSGNKKRIEVGELTESKSSDIKELVPLLDKVDGEIGKILLDGAYDAASSYAAGLKRRAKVVVPPRKVAKTQYGKALGSPAVKERNKNIRIMHKFGIANWKKKTGYHKRSLVENAFFRFKTILGDKLASRNFENQKVEALLKCQILNHMAAIGMPQSYVVA